MRITDIFYRRPRLSVLALGLPAHAGSYLLSSLRDYRNVGKPKR